MLILSFSPEHFFPFIIINMLNRPEYARLQEKTLDTI